MKILRKKPRARWEFAEVPNTLEALQAEVGGYIETVSFLADVCAIVNEEGRINHMPYNVKFADLHLFGTVLLVGFNGDEFCDVPIKLNDLQYLPL